MARNFSFLKNKKLWILSVAGVAFFVFFLFLQTEKQEGSTPFPETGSGDSTPPATAIVSPDDRTWHNARFSLAIRDSDIGVGLAPFVPREQGCLYRIEDFGAGTAFGDYRKCGASELPISIGEDQACSSSYAGDSSRGKCRVSTKAIDRVGNESEWKSFLFFVDLENPIVSSVSVDSHSSSGRYGLRGEVADNGKIVSCWLAEDSQVINSKISFDFLPCQEGRSCAIIAEYVPQDASTHTVRFGCQDAAGNVGYGEQLSSLSFINQAPAIELCRVTPSQGNTLIIFQFESASTDPNQDMLSYRWEFGDGTVSQEQHPSHRYTASGTYTPKLIVEDPAGKTDECNTVWVIVGEK